MNLPITINMSRCTGSTFIFFEEISLNMAPIEGLNYKHDWNGRFPRNVPALPYLAKVGTCRSTGHSFQVLSS